MVPDKPKVVHDTILVVNELEFLNDPKAEVKLEKKIEERTDNEAYKQLLYK